jgi:hypothetical protein
MMAHVSSILVLVTSLALAACGHVSEMELQVGPPPKLASSEQSAFERVIHDFARAKKWSPEEYSIKLVGAYSGIVVFSLSHRDDTAVGGGKSVELHIDRTKMKIVRELAYQ